MKYTPTDWKALLLLIFCLCSFSVTANDTTRLSGNKKDSIFNNKTPFRNHLYYSVSGHAGSMLKLDEYIKDFLKTTSEQIYSVKVNYQTLPSDSNRYASDYNYPTFSLGFSIMDNSRVEMYNNDNKVEYISRMGLSYALYGSFQRPILRRRKFSISYTFENGIAYETKPYNKYTNIANELTGSSLLLYFGAGIHFYYKPVPNFEIGFGPEFSHLSNSALDRPNKGSNALGIGFHARYYPVPPPEHFPQLSEVKYPKGFYYNISAGLGIKTLLDEWLYNRSNRDKDDPEYMSGDYKMYLSYNFSADVMYRYARRFGSGIGIDLFYAPYAERIREIEELREFPSRDYDKWSVGIGPKHEAYYGNISLSISLCYYLYRRMGYLAEINDEAKIYERIGLRYHFPSLNNLFVGYHVKAHLTKADFMEFCVGIKL